MSYPNTQLKISDYIKTSNVGRWLKHVISFNNVHLIISTRES